MEVELDLNKKQAEEHKNKGNEYFKKQQYSNAAEEYEKAIGILFKL